MFLFFQSVLYMKVCVSILVYVPYEIEIMKKIEQVLEASGEPLKKKKKKQ